MDQIEIAIGTYENLILGYRVEKKTGSEDLTLESSFTTDSHCGALRCLAVSPQGVLVSSSTDDSIRLHNLKKRREVGTLFQHDGSVNCIRFFKGGHMFSASEDGSICLWKCKNWELLRVLKGHRCHVMAVAVHPSGKLGLSIGNDRTFFTWDLTKGKLAFKRKLDEVAQDLLFTQDGNHYVIVYQKKMELCSLEDTEVRREIKFENKINVVCFVEENVLAVGEDNGRVSVLNVMSNTQLAEKTFRGRVRSLCTVTTEMGLLLVVASSTGSLRVCKLDLTEGDEEIEIVVDYESGTRLTCMSVYAPSEILKDGKEVKENVNVQKGMQDKQRKKRKATDMDESYEDDEKDDSIKDEENSDDVDDDDENEDESDNDIKEEIPDEDSHEEEEGEEKEEEAVKPKKKKRKISTPSPVVSKKNKKQKTETPTMKEKTKMPPNKQKKRKIEALHSKKKRKVA